MAALRKSLLAMAALLMASGAVLHAQPPKALPKTPPKTQAAQPSGPPNALQGFSQNRNEPVHIEAATLEVHDKQKEATFSGDVHVTQGDTDLRCKSLVVFYEQGDSEADKKNTMPAADAGPGGQQHIKRLEARGSVIVTQKDQTVTGELGIFDMKSNTVTLTGNVLMTQGRNVLRGQKLVVDLASGVSRVESAMNGHGRVEGLFVPSSGPSGAAPGLPGSPPAAALPGASLAAPPATKPAAKPAERARASQPMPLQPPH